MKKCPFISWTANLLLKLRNRHFFGLDSVVLLLTPVLALMLRIDSLDSLPAYLPALALYTIYALFVRLVIFRGFGFYSRYWRYASIEELLQVAAGGMVATLFDFGILLSLRIPGFGICEALPAACGLPRSIPLIDGLLALVAVGVLRFSVRLAAVWVNRRRPGGSARRVLVMGAGNAGAMIVKEMRSNPQLGLEPVGFVDDDMYKHDVRIHGLPVLGGRHDIPEIVHEYRVAQVIIAMPTAPGKVIREVVEICERAGVETKTMPGIYELLDGAVSVNQLRDVEIEDLLRRDPIKTDIAAVQELLRGKRVLVTGGGGSIGSELCRQIMRCGPSELVLLGHGENSIFGIHNELQGGRWKAEDRKRRVHSSSSTLHSPPYIIPIIADIRFPGRIRTIFEQYRPQIVFHAAAHKHVPLMEANPAEAITNNVLGTRNVLDAALAVGVERFVMISTDKAVNPTSIMGASKRAAELLVHRAARESGRPYVAVRFGNVLGSRGSVVLTFKQQIAHGGPVTVTDPEVRRYFMTIPEAVQLVLQAAVLATEGDPGTARGGSNGGKVFVLDMGDPIKIVDLAHDLIELSGLEVGRDIDIEFVGLRPGEKLFEELFIAGERYGRTRHEKIFIAGNASSLVPNGLDAAIAALAASAQRNDRAAIVQDLKALVPEFRPQ